MVQNVHNDHVKIYVSLSTGIKPPSW